MKALLIVTAVLEAGTGLAFLLSTAVPVEFLLRTPLDTPGALVVGRVTGAALLSLGVACWCARNDIRSRAATGVIMAMLSYNIAVVALLTDAGVRQKMIGIGLWPGVALHVGMAVWCGICIHMRRG